MLLKYTCCLILNFYIFQRGPRIQLTPFEGLLNAAKIVIIFSAAYHSLMPVDNATNSCENTRDFLKEWTTVCMFLDVRNNFRHCTNLDTAQHSDHAVPCLLALTMS